MQLMRWRKKRHSIPFESSRDEKDPAVAGKHKFEADTV